MSCFHPSLAVDLGIPNIESGKRQIKFLSRYRVDWNLEKYRSLYGDSLLLLPCGHCIGCLQDYRQTWAVRILLESMNHEANSFITLTYNDSCLPSDNKPHRSEFVKFFKRLRKAINVPVKVFYSGEKGERSGRAHYHAVIFGYDFPDKVLHGRTAKGSLIWRSPILEKCWPFGMSSVGEVEPGSACYVAQYCDKKKLTRIDDGSFIGMSRRPGIGFSNFNLNWFKSDTIYNALGESSIPRFYKKMFEGLNPDSYQEYKNVVIDRMRQRQFSWTKYQVRNEEEALSYQEKVKLYNFVNKRRNIL